MYPGLVPLVRANCAREDRARYGISSSGVPQRQTHEAPLSLAHSPARVEYQGRWITNARVRSPVSFRAASPHVAGTFPVRIMYANSRGLDTVLNQDAGFAHISWRRDKMQIRSRIDRKRESQAYVRAYMRARGRMHIFAVFLAFLLRQRPVDSGN